MSVSSSVPFSVFFYGSVLLFILFSILHLFRISVCNIFPSSVENPAVSSSSPKESSVSCLSVAILSYCCLPLHLRYHIVDPKLKMIPFHHRKRMLLQNDDLKLSPMILRICTCKSCSNQFLFRLLPFSAIF